MSHPCRSIRLFCCILIIFGTANCLSAQQSGLTWSIPLYEPGQNPPEQNQIPANQLSTIPKFQIDLFGGTVIVPKLKGLTWTEAEEKLNALNLTAEKKNEEALSVDTVDYQNPRAGLEVEMGTPVGLRLVTKIPDVVGKPLGDAYDLLKDAGFKIKYFREWDKGYDVTGQVPKPGGLDIRGKTITLQCNVKVPDVIKRTVAEARKILEMSDIYAVIPSHYRDDDLIFKQQYKPGRMIPRRFTMEIVPGVIVPNVSNVDLATAEIRLINKGIPAKVVALNKVVTFNVNDHGKTLVTAQAVRPGNFIFRGNTLELKVSQLIYQELRIPEPHRFKPLDYGPKNGYKKPSKTPQQQAKCPECGKPLSQCKCFLGAG